MCKLSAKSRAKSRQCKRTLRVHFVNIHPPTGSCTLKHFTAKLNYARVLITVCHFGSSIVIRGGARDLTSGASYCSPNF